jgi:hypothetical protein
MIFIFIDSLAPTNLEIIIQSYMITFAYHSFLNIKDSKQMYKELLNNETLKQLFTIEFNMYFVC